MMYAAIQYLFILLFIHLIAAVMVSNMKWVRVTVPQYRIPGETATLQCQYKLENSSLYAVKWYKDDDEFYRFVPKARPKARDYPVAGVHVDLSKSDNTRVALHSIDLKSSGVYKCEVSAEAPTFASAQSESRMDVVSLPEEDPVITGVEMQYQIGDDIALNCTSGKSHPASILHWYINEQQIQNPDSLIVYPPEHHDSGLVSTTLGLKFRLSEHHFRGGSMKVKCVASIAPILYRSELESVVESQSIPVREMREALLLVRSAATRNISPLSYLVLLVVPRLMTT